MTTPRKRRKAPKPPDPDEHTAGAPPERVQCTATTAKGRRCLRKALEGSDLCAVHMGAPVGRKAKLDEDVAQSILQVLRVGGYAETAAAAAGISKQTYYNWLERGDPEGTKKEDAPFRAFVVDVEKARAEGETRNVALIQRAAAKDWKAAAWMLERTYPGRWSGPRGRTLRSDHLDEPALADDGNVSGGVTDDQVGPDGKPL